jgi:hypothetical protein
MNFLSHQQSQLLTVSQGRYPPAQYSQEIKVVPSTEVTTTHTGVWGSGGIASCFFTSALGGSESLASRPGRFTPEEKTSIPNAEMVRWAPKRGWMLWLRESPPLTGIEPQSSSPQLSHYTELHLFFSGNDIVSKTSWGGTRLQPVSLHASSEFTLRVPRF